MRFTFFERPKLGMSTSIPMESTASVSTSQAGSRSAASRKSALGTTSYGGDYQHSNGWRFTINPSSGKGDVVAQIGNLTLTAECKGGVINTRHPGQVSRIRAGTV